MGSVVNLFEELNREKNEILAFPVFPLDVSNFANEKARRNIFWGVYIDSWRRRSTIDQL